MPPPDPAPSPAELVAHAGIHGWDGKELGAGERVLAHWSAHHGHLVLTDRRVLLLSHPHLLSLKREVEWISPLEDLKNLEVIQAPSLLSAHRASTSTAGSVGPSSTVAPQPTTGPAGTEKPPSDVNFEVVVDGMVLFKGIPLRAQEIQQRIDEAMGARLTALGRLRPGPGAGSA